MSPLMTSEREMLSALAAFTHHWLPRLEHGSDWHVTLVACRDTAVRVLGKEERVDAATAAGYLGIPVARFQEEAARGEWPTHRDMPGAPPWFLLGELGAAARHRTPKVRRLHAVSTEVPS